MECNIGEKGKAARLKLGIFTLICSGILALTLLLGIFEGSFLWVAVAGSAFGGAFSIWEARAGWCIVRAMGFKTPL